MPTPAPEQVTGPPSGLLRFTSTMRNQPMRNRKGFTLIELLIVVVIIGILAAIAIPKFSSVKQKGYKTQAIAELQSIKTAEETFFTDSNRYGQITELASYSHTSSVGSPNVTPSTSYWLRPGPPPPIPGSARRI